MDKSLDDIIAARPKGIRRTTGRRSGARTQILGTPVVSPTARARAAAAPANGTKAAAAPPQPSQSADKIIVSGLPKDVNETQIKELFHTMVGPLRDVTLHYDSAGRSKGVAAVQFQKKGDGTKACEDYNNRLIDGKYPMRIEIVVDPSRPTVRSLASRVAPAAQAVTTNGVQAQTPRTSGPRGRRGRGGRARKAERPAKSAADLDAEMEDYTASNAPTAAV